MPARLIPADGGLFSARSSQVATPLLSRCEILKKSQLWKGSRGRREGATLAGKEKAESGKKPIKH